MSALLIGELDAPRKLTTSESNGFALGGTFNLQESMKKSNHLMDQMG